MSMLQTPRTYNCDFSDLKALRSRSNLAGLAQVKWPNSRILSSVRGASKQDHSCTNPSTRTQRISVYRRFNCRIAKIRWPGKLQNTKNTSVNVARFVPGMQARISECGKTELAGNPGCD